MSDAFSDIAKQTDRALEIVMANNSPDSAKKHQSFQENMKRLHGEIERMIYAAEIACPNTSAGKCVETCPFTGREDIDCDWWCRLGALRKAIGEVAEIKRRLLK